MCGRLDLEKEHAYEVAEKHSVRTGCSGRTRVRPKPDRGQESVRRSLSLGTGQLLADRHNPGALNLGANRRDHPRLDHRPQGKEGYSASSTTAVASLTEETREGYKKPLNTAFGGFFFLLRQ